MRSRLLEFSILVSALAITAVIVIVRFLDPLVGELLSQAAKAVGQ